MTKQVVSIQSVTAATGWWFTKDHSTFEPLAVWAVVELIDAAHPSFGLPKGVIGLGGDEIDDLEFITFDQRWYYHESQFEILGQELK